MKDSSKIKSVSPDVRHKQRKTKDSREDELLYIDIRDGDSSQIDEQVSDRVFDRTRDSHQDDVENASISSCKIERREKQPDSTSMSSDDLFFSLPPSHSETSSVSSGAIANAARITNTHSLKDEGEKPFHEDDKQVLYNGSLQGDTSQEESVHNSVRWEESLVVR